MNKLLPIFGFLFLALFPSQAAGYIQNDRSSLAPRTTPFTNWVEVTTRTHEGFPKTGLLYHNARYYSPGLGRFISRDPIGESGGANLCAFVNNNPAGGIDVLGYATYFSDPYSLNSSIFGTTAFDSYGFFQDFQSLSNSFDSVYSSAGSHFATKNLPHAVSLNNNWSNFGEYWGNVWNRNIAKNTPFNNDYWEPFHSRELTATFLGNPLSFSGTDYGLDA